MDNLTFAWRGELGDQLRQAWTRLSADAFTGVGEFYDDTLRDRRFTTAHAQAAGYTARKGDRMPRDSRGWRRTYAGRKMLRYKHDRPLELTGRTRDALRTGGRYVTTADGVTIRYSQARVFNFRHPRSQVRMADEFRRFIPEEIPQLAAAYDSRLQRELANADFAKTG